MKITHAVSSSGEVSNEYHYTLDEIDDPENFNVYRYDVTIDLERCPFCGTTGMLNQNSRGWYGWCSICGSAGPNHWDWVKAAKMWNDHSFRTVVESYGMNPEKFERMDQDRLSDEAKTFLQGVRNEH